MTPQNQEWVKKVEGRFKPLANREHVILAALDALLELPEETQKLYILRRASPGTYEALVGNRKHCPPGLNRKESSRGRGGDKRKRK